MKKKVTTSTQLGRRKMLKNSGLALAGLGTVSAVNAQPSETTNQPQANKVALITGGARGIGRATAIALAKEGADIVICDIAKQIPSILYPMAVPADLATTKKLVEAEGVQCLSMQADVRSSEDLDKVVAKTIANFGRLDIVVAN